MPLPRVTVAYAYQHLRIFLPIRIHQCDLVAFGAQPWFGFTFASEIKNLAS